MIAGGVVGRGPVVIVSYHVHCMAVPLSCEECLRLTLAYCSNSLLHSVSFVATCVVLAEVSPGGDECTNIEVYNPI